MRLSSGLARAEQFIDSAGFDRAPWLAVGFAAGIGAWFMLPGPAWWIALIAALLAVFAAALMLLRPFGRYPYLRQAIAGLTLVAALGCAAVWTKSAIVGAQPIVRPLVARLEGTVLGRTEQPAQDRVRLLVAVREPGTGRAILVRVNVPQENDVAGLGEGAKIRFRARLMPPAPPMLPGSYDFARTAWFAGLAATGSVIGPVELRGEGAGGGALGNLQRRLSAHVRQQIGGSPGALAAAFASGDRGAIPAADDAAMRDAGLAHLLSISGLHVSAVVAAVYVLAMRLLGLWPWLTLRTRLPLLAAGLAAGSGIFYTLLTGAEVPTVRSCIGAVLVLVALALGREPLSLRMVAVAAFVVLLLWPEALVGPSFQMSFAAVIAIVTLHDARPIRAFLTPRDESWAARLLRQIAMLLLTGVVIELALMPIGLFHFHRAGAYGALANVAAIPLTTFVSMPLIALALLFDSVGLGAPFWWLAGQSLALLLWIARITASQPGAVSLLPAMGTGAFALFVAGGLWLALWRGRIRLAGLVPASLGALMLTQVQAPDLLITGDGRNIGITGESGGLIVLREGKGDYVRENLQEIAGMSGPVAPLARWPQARCNRDFCAFELVRAGRETRVLVARGRDFVEERAVAAACERADIVIADRRLPRSCRSAWLKADRAMLGQTGGLAVSLADRDVDTVARHQGAHGWWQPAPPWKPRSARAAPASGARPAP